MSIYRLIDRHTFALTSYHRVDRTKYQIQIPLPPKIDASVTMMQVEEKPDVTYSDIGGCKEQIEKLREVVETPLLSVSCWVSGIRYKIDASDSPNVSLNSVLTHRKVCFSSAHRVQARRYVPVQSQTERMRHSFV